MIHMQWVDRILFDWILPHFIYLLHLRFCLILIAKMIYSKMSQAIHFAGNMIVHLAISQYKIVTDRKYSMKKSN